MGHCLPLRHLMIVYSGKGIIKAIEGGKISGKNLIADILAVADVVDSAMGGTSGALYS